MFSLAEHVVHPNELAFSVSLLLILLVGMTWSMYIIMSPVFVHKTFSVTLHVIVFLVIAVD